MRTGQHFPLRCLLSFDGINVFVRRASGAPRVGEIIDIDILGPENGSVTLAEISATYFVFQTIDCPKNGSHPENGSREFGFQRSGSAITFYTRGLSRPGNFIIGLVGSWPQRKGWTALLNGIANQIVARGGRADLASFSSVKETRSN